MAVESSFIVQGDPHKAWVNYKDDGGNALAEFRVQPPVQLGEEYYQSSVPSFVELRANLRTENAASFTATIEASDRGLLPEDRRRILVEVITALVLDADENEQGSGVWSKFTGPSSDLEVIPVVAQD